MPDDEEEPEEEERTTKVVLRVPAAMREALEAEAESEMELPSETARRILREHFADDDEDQEACDDCDACDPECTGHEAEDEEPDEEPAS